MDITKLNQDYLNEIINYNLDTGICFWNHRPRTDFRYAKEHKAWNNKHAETQISSINPSNNKITVSLFQRGWVLDQLLWKMLTNEVPAMVYHANGYNVDNSAKNLTQEHPPQKSSKYAGGEVALTKTESGLFAIASGPIDLVAPPIKLRPPVHLFNLFVNRKDARTFLLELVDKLECNWTNYDETY